MFCLIAEIVISAKICTSKMLAEAKSMTGMGTENGIDRVMEKQIVENNMIEYNSDVEFKMKF